MRPHCQVLPRQQRLRPVVLLPPRELRRLLSGDCYKECHQHGIGAPARQAVAAAKETRTSGGRGEEAGSAAGAGDQVAAREFPRAAEVAIRFRWSRLTNRLGRIEGSDCVVAVSAIRKHSARIGPGIDGAMGHCLALQPRGAKIGGGYYYWNNGLLHPAWGYNPSAEYYAYDF